MSGIKVPSFITPYTIRILKWILIVIVGIVLFIFVAGRGITYYANKKIHKALESVGGQVGNLNVNLFFRRVTAYDFELNLPGDNTHPVPTTAHIKTIRLSSINLYQLIVNKKLRIGEILIENGNVDFNKKIVRKDSTASSKKNPLQEIAIQNIIIRRVKVSIVSDSVHEMSGVVNATFTDIQSPDSVSLSDIKKYGLKNLDIKISKLLITTPELYQIKVGSIQAISERQELRVDSVMLVPRYSKFKFARVAGKQTDRINTFIKRIDVKGLDYSQLKDSAFVASTIEIASGELSSFRDKRLPFKETKNKPLPMAALKELSFGIEVDTIKIKDTKITYEEFPSDGFRSGKLVFENLNATLVNLSNRPYYNKPDHATLNAKAMLMGKGQIQATFLLPQKENEPYQAEGKIGNFPLHHLNPVLQNLAFINIESGKLNALNFKFNYTDKLSSGKLTINYEDLKINGLKKEKSVIINDFKTLLINTVVKNDKDKSVPTEKRTGTISFERDRKRQIFNYWWKSLLSGIKSGVLDN